MTEFTLTFLNYSVFRVIHLLSALKPANWRGSRFIFFLIILTGFCGCGPKIESEPTDLLDTISDGGTITASDMNTDEIRASDDSAQATDFATDDSGGETETTASPESTDDSESDTSMATDTATNTTSDTDSHNDTDNCDTDNCVHGTCVNTAEFEGCNCDARWTGKTCSECATGWAGQNCLECAADYGRNGDGDCVDSIWEECINTAPVTATASIEYVPLFYHSDASGWSTPDECSWVCRDGWTGPLCDEYTAAIDNCIVYVNARNGSNTADGLSWDSAFYSIQIGIDIAAALVQANDAFEECDVWVASGVYWPEELLNVARSDIDSQKKTIALREFVNVYGGFSGEESLFDERDVSSNPTILYGDGAYHVVTGADYAILDGFTVSDGDARGDGVDSRGGGMLNIGVSPIVQNCNFQFNHADSEGGAVYNENTSVRFSNCSFLNNRAYRSEEWCHSDFYGGFVCWYDAVNEFGGAMLNRQTNVNLENCYFSENTAGWGGGMFNVDSVVTAINTRFKNNTVLRTENAELTDHLNGDVDGDGGAVYDLYTATKLINCAVTDNVAQRNGGGLYLGSDSSATIIGCTIAGNSAVADGGGVFNASEDANFRNTILWENKSRIDDWGEPKQTEGNQIFSTAKPPLFSYSNVQGSCEVLDPAVCDDGNIDADPLFVADSSVDLSENSPCIDAGNNAAIPGDVVTDLNGNPRVINDVVDIGASEFSADPD